VYVVEADRYFSNPVGTAFTGYMIKIKLTWLVSTIVFRTVC